MKEKYKKAIEAVVRLSEDLDQLKKENADLQSRLDIANALSGKCQSCLVVSLLTDQITDQKKIIKMLEQSAPKNTDQLIAGVCMN